MINWATYLLVSQSQLNGMQLYQYWRLCHNHDHTSQLVNEYQGIEHAVGLVKYHFTNEHYIPIHLQESFKMGIP